MRYVLVHWSAGSPKTSIVTEEYVLDKSMLDDPDKEGLVAFVQQPGDKFIPKHQVTAHLGRVKYVNEHREIIEEHQRLFLAVKSNPNPSHRLFSPKNRKRQRSESDDVCDTTSHDISKEDGQQNRPIIQILEDRIQNLEDELTNLRRTNLMLQNNLPDLLRDALQSSPVVELFKTCSKCSCNSHVNDFKSREATLCSVEETSPVRETSSEELNSWSQSAADPPKDDNQETKFWMSSRNVSLTDLLDSENMERVSRSLTYKKMTTALLLSLFEKPVLAKSSVTGKSKAGRPALDNEIVNLIIDHVQQCFPHTRYQDIKATMAQKCKDLRKCTEKRDVPPKVED